MMVYFDQLSMQDCATILNVPEGTVKSRLFTAKKTLREMIKDYNEQNETPLNFKATTMEAMITAVLLKEYGAFSNHALLGATTKTQHFSPRGIRAHGEKHLRLPQSRLPWCAWESAITITRIMRKRR